MADTSPLRAAIDTWLADPDGDVVYAEELEGKWAVRMRQTVRDATTVWWEEGSYTISAEAYVLPAPPGDASGAYRLALRRNHSSWRVHFALDAEGAFVLRGRVGSDASFHALDQMLGEIYQLVEISFRPLVSLALGRREKTP